MEDYPEYLSDYYLEDIIANQESLIINLEEYHSEIVSFKENEIEILKYSLFIQTSFFISILGFLTIVVFLRGLFRSVGN